MGAADVALERLIDVVIVLFVEARIPVEGLVEETRHRIVDFQEDFPAQLEELRGRFSADDLRGLVEDYLVAVQVTYTELVERGEFALGRLRSQPGIFDAANRVEGYTDQAVELTREALSNVGAQTRAVGERAAKLVGVELPRKTEKRLPPAKVSPEQTSPGKRAAKTSSAKKAPAQKARAKKAPAKKYADAARARKSPAKMTADDAVAKTPAKKAPAKMPAKKGAAKMPAKKAPAKKAAAKRATQE